MFITTPQTIELTSQRVIQLPQHLQRDDVKLFLSSSRR